MPDFEYLKDKQSPFPGIDISAQVHAKRIIEAAMERAWTSYKLLIQVGAKGEDARFVLPNACETKIIITMNARELRHFFTLRMSKHAQWEIRAMAKSMYDLVMIVAGPFFEDLKEIRGE
jgi:thymidylate synthase (FAD)